MPLEKAWFQQFFSSFYMKIFQKQIFLNENIQYYQKQEWFGFFV